MELLGKTALITGSTSGIGYSIASKLAAKGADIFLNSFTDTPSDHRLATDLSQKHSVSAKYISADLRIASQARSLVTQTKHIDILVNNAGIQHVSSIEALPLEKWDDMIAIMLSAVFHTTAIALPMMRKAKWGRIINISSAHGLVASPQKAAYVAAKHGVIGLTKVAALETAEEPITVNAVCPGFTETPLLEKQIPTLMKQYSMTKKELIDNILMERQPSKKFVTSEQISGLVQFLCSKDADQITGSAISIDGGWTAL
jgi:3-hydroxybutyrate dehydrogenase